MCLFGANYATESKSWSTCRSKFFVTHITFRRFPVLAPSAYASEQAVIALEMTRTGQTDRDYFSNASRVGVLSCYQYLLVSGMQAQTPEISCPHGHKVEHHVQVPTPEVAQVLALFSTPCRCISPYDH